MRAERHLAAGLLALSLAGCAGRDKDAQAPLPTSIEEAEQRLAENRRALEDAGISVPTATIARAEAPPPTGGEDGDEFRQRTDDSEPVADERPNAGLDDFADESDASPAMTPAPVEAEEELESASSETVGGAIKRRRTNRKKRRKEATRCERMCGLAEATCDLQAQICNLAERHVTDVRYERACEQAQLQCDAAARECQRCGR